MLDPLDSTIHCCVSGGDYCRLILSTLTQSLSLSLCLSLPSLSLSLSLSHSVSVSVSLSVSLSAFSLSLSLSLSLFKSLSRSLPLNLCVQDTHTCVLTQALSLGNGVRLGGQTASLPWPPVADEEM